MKARTSGEDLTLHEESFKTRYRENFKDPNFNELSEEVEKITDIAWRNYAEGRKAPITQKAGVGFHDPDYDLSLEWIKARAAIHAAQEEHADATGPRRILIISGSDRNDQTCPGEISKSIRLLHTANKTFQDSPDTEVEILDLSKITSEYGKTIHPCKGCVSTAMPLCHWPCSCYPNYSLGQIHDWMNEIYPMWVRAHGIMIITPVYWHQAPSALKLMIDRLVCADGGNEDPTSTHGKRTEEAKELELQGWNYPRHLKGRMFSVIVHGDAAGVDNLKNSLTDWLEEMELVPVTNHGVLGRYIGYMGTYAESHLDLDKDQDMVLEVKNAARALVESVSAYRHHQFTSLNLELQEPRPK
jgi:multimeric flavodoxin WrbA